MLDEQVKVRSKVQAMKYVPVLLLSLIIIYKYVGKKSGKMNL
jgi:hypothetical protein